MLLSYAWARRRGWSAVALVSLLGTVAGLLAPLPLKVLVDNVLGGHRVPGTISWLPGTDTRHGLLAWVVACEILVFAASAG